MKGKEADTYTHERDEGRKKEDIRDCGRKEGIMEGKKEGRKEGRKAG
jgi:hypothetical protein